MKGLESGKDKVKKICDVLKKETLEPAMQEAEEIVMAARQEADELLADAKIVADRMLEDTKMEMERQKAVFHASLKQACRQTIDSLKEAIEQKLMSPELSRLVTQPLQDPKLIVQIITAIVRAIEKEGLEGDLSVAVAAAVPARAVNELLVSAIVQRLREKAVVLSSIGGGVEVKIVKENMTIDLSDVTIKELVASYLRKDFRKFVFGE